MIRAFIAVEIQPQTRDRIVAAMEQLKTRVSAVRWVAPSNLHLTLKFLGDIEESKIDPIGTALSTALCPFPRCTINVKGLGVFPSSKRPRVLWVGLEGPGLVPLAAQVESALVPLGFAPDQRGFTPHLTIGRWRQSDRTGKTLEQELQRWVNYDFGTSRADEVILFQSVLRPTGAIYTRLKVVALKNDGSIA